MVNFLLATIDTILDPLVMVLLVMRLGKWVQVMQTKFICLCLILFLITNETKISIQRYLSYFQIAGNQPTRLFQTKYARFWMLKNVKNQFKILNVYKF